MAFAGERPARRRRTAGPGTHHRVVTGTTGRLRLESAIGDRCRVTAALAARLTGEAYLFYRPLPSRPIGARDLLGFGGFGLFGDVRLLIMMGLLTALLGLVTPMVTGPLFSEVLPRADLPSFTAMVIGTVLAAIGNATFEVVRSFAMLRLQGRMDNQQFSFWLLAGMSAR